jgi:hypothetical protein
MPLRRKAPPVNRVEQAAGFGVELAGPAELAAAISSKYSIGCRS